MQDFNVNAVVRIGPDFAQAERQAVEDAASYEVDEASLAQFEALLPAAPGDRIDMSDADHASSDVGSVSGAGAASTTASMAAMSPSEFGGRPKEEPVPSRNDALISSYTIHHARVGVVHVEQSSGGPSGIGAMTLRTDDDALRVRLRDAVPSLRGALAFAHGPGFDISVDA